MAGLFHHSASILILDPPQSIPPQSIQSLPSIPRREMTDPDDGKWKSLGEAPLPLTICCITFSSLISFLPGVIIFLHQESPLEAMSCIMSHTCLPSFACSENFILQDPTTTLNRSVMIQTNSSILPHGFLLLYCLPLVIYLCAFTLFWWFLLFLFPFTLPPFPLPFLPLFTFVPPLPALPAFSLPVGGRSSV